MRIDWHTLLLQAANFAVLVWLLQHFLYRPVLRLVDARRAEIDKQYREAHAAEAEAKERLAAVNSRRAAIDAERSQVLKAAATEAESAAETRGAAAERQAAALLEEARKSLAAERKQALAEARRAALDLSAAFARRLLEEFPPSLRSEAWLERICAHLAKLPPEKREALIGQLSGAAPPAVATDAPLRVDTTAPRRAVTAETPAVATAAGLQVATAEALPPEVLQRWRGKLSAALGGCAVSFAVDPALGAGAELHFPAATLCFSLRSATAALRAELEQPASASPAPGGSQPLGSSPAPPS